MSAIIKSTRPPPGCARSRSPTSCDSPALAEKSSMVPPAYKGQPESIVARRHRMVDELGLAPMQCLRNIAVVNGRPASGATR